MASYPKQTVYNNILQAGPDNNWYDIPVTINCRRMEITEVPPASGANQGAFAPQGLQYQLWDASTQAWGPTLQLLPGDVLVLGDKIAEGRAHGPIIGWRAQTITGGVGQGLATKARAADVPVRIQSGNTGGANAATQVLVTEYA